MGVLCAVVRTIYGGVVVCVCVRTRLPTTKNRCVELRNHEGWHHVPLTQDLGKRVIVPNTRNEKTKTCLIV